MNITITMVFMNNDVLYAQHAVVRLTVIYNNTPFLGVVLLHQTTTTKR